MKAGTPTFPTSSGNLQMLAFCQAWRGGEVHLANTDGFFSNRCHGQASSPCVLVLFVFFNFLH